MKRANEIDEGGGKTSESKKARSLGREDDEGRDAAEMKVEEESYGRGGFEQLNNNNGNMSKHPQHPSLDLNDFNLGNFEVNLGSMFGGPEEKQNQKGVEFDLNVPFCQSSDGGSGMSNGAPESSRRPNKEVINIESDDSEDEVEVVGFTHGYNQNRRQIELGMPSNRIENLNLGLGMSGGFNEDGALMGAERRYAREERSGHWLSLNADVSIDLNLATGIDNIRPPVTTVDLEVLAQPPPQLPPGLFALAEVAERELGREEAVSEQRLRVDRVVQIVNARHLHDREQEREREIAHTRYLRLGRMRAAKRLARDLDDERASSSKKEVLPASSSMKQLGKLSGPFSEALNKVRGRTPKGGARQLIEWKPSVENQDKAIIPPSVPSLMDLSLKTLAENVEAIVSLELVPDNLRKRLTNMLCDTRKINADFLLLLIEGCTTEICIKNCSWISEPLFEEMFQNLETKELRELQLDLCGQFMLDLALRKKILQSSKSFSNLSTVSLRGACRLTDDGVKDLVASAPALQSLNLGQCSLLTSDAINCIADSLGPNLRELYIDECLKIDPMLILPAFEKFRCLEVISVANIPSITDQFVREMVALCGEHLRELDLAICLELTDSSLEIIGSNCPRLCCLNISNLDKMTDLGLEHLANGCRWIRKLRFCRNGFSDEAMATFLESSGENLTELSLNHMTQSGPNTAFSIAKCAKELISLDISWCRKITNDALGLIVDSCSSLKQLKLFGCRQITDEFFKRHSNPLVKIIGRDNAPLLAHLNLLKPEY